MSININLKEIRSHKELTQGELAEMANLKVLQISRIERGETNPRMDTLKKLAVALNCTTDELVFDENERQVPDELKMLLEGMLRLPEEKQKIAVEILEALIMKSDAESWIKKKN